jgi:purine-binding chemotaxis protein CheW
MMEIAQIEPNQLFNVPSIVNSKGTSYMKAVTNVDGRLVILLNHDKILTEEEQSKIKSVLSGNTIK